MELYKITKGNFCLNATSDKRPHQNNLRYHIKINEKHPSYESYDRFSANERKNNLFKYLGLFSRRDDCPDKYYEESDDDSETETE